MASFGKEGCLEKGRVGYGLMQGNGKRAEQESCITEALPGCEAG